MSLSNRDRVGRALDLLNEGLKPFVVRELEAAYGPRWRYEVVGALRDHHFTDDGQDLRLDIQALLLIMWDQWNQVFKKTLGHAERNYVSELREARNKWAHQEPFSTQLAYRVLDSIQLLLVATSATTQADEVERQKMDLLRISFDEQARNITRRNTGPLLEGSTPKGLLPWREVITPHPDVASGNYPVAEFAADLSQVYRGLATSEYADPYAFFQRTFLTNGLHQLLVGALRRLTGNGGDPIVELQTNFGGGKTHSLLSLYHLFSSASAPDLFGVEPLLHEVGVEQSPEARRAVLVGHAISPAQVDKKADGCEVHTMWGEMAWQLLGKEGYAMVAEDDRAGVSPGSEVLRRLFVAASPALILIDEWVVLVRQLYSKGEKDLVAGSFEANLSFAQNLTEAAKAAPRTLVVATIPASESEAGGEGGLEALSRLKSIFGRVESPWRPADPEEGFEIVRRRLFESIPAQLYPARDATAHSFSEYYRSQRQEFPDESAEANYERRIKSCYPIHPELFDRLFNDWSSIAKFQRTRGVLRLMASVVHELWVKQDRGLLIMPASIPLDAPAVQSMFTQYLEDNWVPIIEKDIDGGQSLPQRLDSSNPNFGRFAATRRVARAIFFSSAPTLQSTNKGVQDTSIKLSCAQPGESVATFGDALRRLTDQATYLYQNDRRYWYDTQPSVTRLAQDRATQYDDETVYQLIKSYLRAEQRQKADFASVHPCPDSGADVLDENNGIRLVILKPHYPHTRRNQESSAMQEATKILNQRGSSPRTYRNTLIFLAADHIRIEELKQATRLFMAWDSIEKEHESLNLDAFKWNQARTQRKHAEERILALIPETYAWLLVPEQSDPRRPDYITEYKLANGEGVGLLPTSASRLLRTEELLITKFAGLRLRQEMDRIPLWSGNHASVKKLIHDFACYIYLPRLKHNDVLLAAISDGLQAASWRDDTFAYASGWQEERQRYSNLQAGRSVNITVDDQSLLVKPDSADDQLTQEAAALEARAAQLASNMTAAAASNGQAPYQETPLHKNIVREGNPSITQIPLTVAAEKRLHRFYGSVQINERMMASEAGKIMEEVVKHLTSLSGARVRVTLEISAELPDGAPDHTVRTVKENSNTLRFQTSEFHEE
ncbi:MAG: Swt1 family HEPN domain-containing protein [Ktedonobacteraceae bacterium]